MRAKFFCIFYFCGLNYVYVPKKSKEKKKVEKNISRRQQNCVENPKNTVFGGKQLEKIASNTQYLKYFIFD